MTLTTPIPDLALDPDAFETPEAAPHFSTNDLSQDTPAGRDRAAINRENAQHSTGPRTAAGKTKIRLNAVKHGATSKQALLPGESPTAFDLLSTHLVRLYAPQTECERDILNSIRDLKWKIKRLNRFEDSFLFTVHAEALAAVDDTYADPNGEILDDRTRFALAEGASYKDNCKTLNQLHRHGRTLRRELRENEIDIRAAIAARLPAEGLQGAPEECIGVPYARALDLQQDAYREAAAEMEAEFEAASTAKESEADTQASGFVLHDSPQPASVTPRAPKFAGPNRKQDRKNWLRKQRNAPVAA